MRLLISRIYYCYYLSLVHPNCVFLSALSWCAFTFGRPFGARGLGALLVSGNVNFAGLYILVFVEGWGGQRKWQEGRGRKGAKGEKRKERERNVAKKDEANEEKAKMENKPHFNMRSVYSIQYSEREFFFTSCLFHWCCPRPWRCLFCMSAVFTDKLRCTSCVKTHKRNGTMEGIHKGWMKNFLKRAGPGGLGMEVPQWGPEVNLR